MKKPMNSATPKPVLEKRPDLAAALDGLDSSMLSLEELVTHLTARLSPVCSDQDEATGPANVVVQSMCQVSANMRELDKRAYALICRLRYLLSALEV